MTSDSIEAIRQQIAALEAKREKVGSWIDKEYITLDIAALYRRIEAMEKEKAK